VEARTLFDPALFTPKAKSRRVLALVFPQLLCELIEQHLIAPGEVPSKAVVDPRRGQTQAVPAESKRARQPKQIAFGVVLVKGSEGAKFEPIYDTQLKVSAPLCSVNAEARRLGVRAGQSIVEAQAVQASLQVFQVTEEQLQQALGRLAEMVMDLGPLVALGAPDTVWVDITGASHLRGGEAALLSEVVERVRAFGHRVRAAIAEGPLLAKAFALWGSQKAGPPQIAMLPLVALPLSVEQLSFFARLGVLNVGQLQVLPKAALSARLGEKSAQILGLAAGEDPTPLVAYQPPRVLAEQVSFLDGISGVEPLLFVLRGLLARVCVRLLGRGEAAEALELHLQHDRSIAEFHGRPLDTKLSFALASPLWKEEELLRVLRSKVERLKLESPTVAVRLLITSIVPAQSRQLTFSSVVAGLTERAFDESELAVLLAELNADIGRENVGILRILDSHRPEARSALFPVVLSSSNQKQTKRKRRKSMVSKELLDIGVGNSGGVRVRVGTGTGTGNSSGTGASPLRAIPFRELSVQEGPAPAVRTPTRLLPKAILIEAVFKVGEIIGLGANLYTIERVLFDHRLEAVQWWSKRPVSRDYVRLWLKGPEGGLAVLGYVNRDSGSHYIQAIYD